MNIRQAQLPEGWEIKKLGEIGKVSMCKRVFKEDTTPEGDIPFYKIGTFGKSPDAFITKAKYDEFRSKFSFPKKGDILISASGTIGRRVRYDGEPAYFQDSNIVWIDNNEKQVLNDYLYRFYEICNWKSTKGATISRLYNDNLKQIEIPFPKSLPEQQRIVSILDECFAAIEKAKANAEQNLKNAKELFESYLQGVFEKKGDGWEEKKLGEVCEIIGGGTPAKNNQKFYEGNIFWATVRDMKAEIIADTEFKISEDAVKKSSTNVIPKNNVIIATRVGLGKICKIQNDTAINQDLRGVIPKNKNFLGVDYLFYWFKSISSQIIAEGKGATVQGVTLPFIKGLEIPLPPPKEQQTIVRQLDALRAETQKLEAVYQKKLDDLEELKKSILQKAFAGELKTEKAVAV